VAKKTNLYLSENTIHRIFNSFSSHVHSFLAHSPTTTINKPYIISYILNLK